MVQSHMARSAKHKNNAGYRLHHQRVRDPLVQDASNGTSPVIIPISVDSSGNYNAVFSLAPFGIQGLTTNNIVAGQPAVFATYVQEPAHMPWLYNQARNFERYRVLNATLVVVGNVGSTATGRMAVDSSTDYADAVTPFALGVTTGGKVFDLSSLSNKDQRFVIDVDSSWKKCSSRTALTNTAGTGALVVSSINDLSFSTIFINVVGGTQNGTAAAFTAANLYLEFDVEFRDPISYGVNA